MNILAVHNRLVKICLSKKTSDNLADSIANSITYIKDGKQENFKEKIIRLTNQAEPHAANLN